MDGVGAAGRSPPCTNRCPEGDATTAGHGPTVVKKASLPGTSRRRRWDLNPRYPGGTTVFETVRFGRSRTPPSERLSGPPTGEELGEEGPTRRRQDPRYHRQLVVQPGVGTEVVDRSARPRLRVGGSEHHGAHSPGHQGPGAHRAR